MANRLKMAMIQAIQQLHAAGLSQRAIARRLGVHRETVARLLQPAQSDSKPAIAPLGSEGPKPANCSSASAREPAAAPSGAAIVVGALPDPSSKPANAPLGSGAGICGATDTTGSPSGAPSKSGASPAGSARQGRPSTCEPFRKVIEAKLRDELSAQRIYQDLVAEQGYTGSYFSVRRLVRKLESRSPLPFRRMECPPGFEAQVDYGTGAPITTSEGKRRHTHVFRMVLSHSRKGYSEVSYRQTTEDFLRSLENAFWHFGGVPHTIVIDNLKAGVQRADWHDPELQPKLRAFCEHYGTAILPARPYMARHKGKIERGIRFVKDNGLKARTFGSLEEQNDHLARWELTVADKRLHGTIRRQVGEVFATIERAALGPLPIERFAFFHEGRRIVSRDGHVEVAKAYYSVPPEYLGRTVWVRWDARLVRVFNQRMEQITLHVRHEPGRFSTQLAHIAPEKISGVERGARWLMARVSLIGPSTTAWSEAMLTARGIEGTRVLMGLIALTKKHSSDALENACRAALSHGEFRLRALRALIARQPERVQAALPFLEAHPLIRPLDDYARVVMAAAARSAATDSVALFGPSGESTVRFTRDGRANECPDHQQKSPGQGTAAKSGGPADQGTRVIHPPGSGSPSSGCSPAGPDSVSPDSSSLRPLFPPLPGESSDDE
jgi:transposase